ncbi:unnamed protein product [Acanthoscelides obtectus]|uniref:Uncharacterized protein n=1 Tax=Acanthoscelides obtectus TaxID=200917 RepID=A0A9P0LU85_ACAOB|nr:unnamed protein product [Acanthoscelides obtectus]CAK1677820.1 hypothetical protein AOBTE_LOCUS31572 [Acanthoscelides obtectus]
MLKKNNSFTSESRTTLKTLNPTRWSGRILSISAAKLRYLDIIKSLTEIELQSHKKEEREEASSIKKQICCFEFVFISTMFYKIFTQLNLASKVLQKKNIDLSESVTVLEQVEKNLTDLRSS